MMLAINVRNCFNQTSLMRGRCQKRDRTSVQRAASQQYLHPHPRPVLSAQCPTSSYCNNILILICVSVLLSWSNGSHFCLGFHLCFYHCFSIWFSQAWNWEEERPQHNPEPELESVKKWIAALRAHPLSDTNVIWTAITFWEVKLPVKWQWFIIRTFIFWKRVWFPLGTWVLYIG